MKKAQVYSVQVIRLDDEEEQREHFGLGHGLIEEKVKVLSTLYFINSWKKIVMILKVCSYYVC